jgi:hypothetical protein
MRSTRLANYLIYSTVGILFSEALFMRVGFDLKIFYVFILINLGLVMYSKGLRLKRGHMFVLGYLFFSGICASFVGNSKLSVFLFQIVGITCTSVYFYQFFRINLGRTQSIFELYCKVSYYVCLIGIVLFAFNIAMGDYNFRLKSIMLEPAHFCGVILPAFYFYLKNFRTYKFRFFVVLASLILSLSSVGYLGIMVCLILIKKKFNLVKLSFFTGIAVILGFVAYITLPFVKLRVDDTFNALTTLEVENVNLSSYALISNLYVSLRVFYNSPIWGNGLGSHEVSHSKYIGSLPGSDTFEDFITLNAADGNSLFIRMLSDFGIIGILAVLFFIFKYYSGNKSRYILSRAILVYFFYKLLREGHYFSPEMYFFVFMFYFSFKESEIEEVPNERFI